LFQIDVELQLFKIPENDLGILRGTVRL
jgi:hypothetical protein